MEKSDKILLSVLTVVIGCALVLGPVFQKPPVVVVSPNGEDNLSGATSHTYGSFDAKQGFWVNGTQVVNSSGQFVSAFNGTNITSTGDSRLSGLVKTGSVATFVTSSAVTAAQVCDNPVWLSASNGASTTTLTLPSTTTLFAASSCLTANGDTISLSLVNADSVTSTVVAAGAGGTLLYSSSTTVAASKAAILQIVRDTALTYKALLVNLAN